MVTEPKTLQQAIAYFADPERCFQFLKARIFPEGAICPNCQSKDVRFVATRRIWECKTKHPKRQFSIKVGTIFEESPIPLDKWMTAVWLIANCKNGVSQLRNSPRYRRDSEISLVHASSHSCGSSYW